MLLVASCLLIHSVRIGIVLPFLEAMSGVALALMVARRPTRREHGQWPAWIAVGGTALFAMQGLLLPCRLLSRTAGRMAALPALAALLGAVLVRRSAAAASRSGLLLAAAVIATVALAGGSLLAERDAPQIDVLSLHRQAAAALARGQSIHGDAVAVPSSSPLALAAEEIVGYPYPPLTALAFSLGQWLIGDPRWGGLLCWTGCLVFCFLIAHRGGRGGPAFSALLLAAMPGWPLVLHSAWTEPLTLLLLAGAMFASSRSPRLSAALLGLGLSTKQYLLVALPLLVVSGKARHAWRWPWWVGAMAASLLPGMIVDPVGSWRSLVVFHLRNPPRQDSSNLLGLLATLGVRITPPPLIGLGVSTALAAWWSRRASDPRGTLIGLSVSLAACFALSPQAFPNYWFLVAGTTALAAAMDSVDSVDSVNSRSD